VKDGKNYALLFLHLSSGTDPRGMGLRDDRLDGANNRPLRPAPRASS